MAALTYTDIQTRCANSLRIPTSNTTEMTKLAAVINEVYRDIGAKYPNWWWLRKRSIINTVADIITGTVNVTNDSTSITFTTGPTASAVGRSFIVTGNTLDSGAVYRVSAHTAGATTATLDAAYTGGTDTAAGYQLYTDSYSLPTDLKDPIFVKRFGFLQPLQIIDPEQMQTIKQYDVSTGKPQVASILDFATTGDPTTARRMIIHPYPDEIYRLELEYNQSLNTELSSTTQPLIPDDYRQILVYGALARGYPIFLDDLQRGLYFQSLFNDVLNLMVAVQRKYEGLPTIAPTDSYRSFYRKGRRISAANVDLGSFFGRWPSRLP